MSEPDNDTLSFNIIQTKQGFEGLEEGWNQLFEESGRPSQLFQTYNWIWHWIDQFPTPPQNLVILTGHQNNELVLIAPLVLTKKAGIKTLQWIGEPVSQYGDIVIKNDGNNLQWLQQGFSFLTKSLKPDLFYLRKTRFDATITPLLENYGATVLVETQAPYIEMLGAKTFAEFNKRYSQRSRKSKRRHRRKLEEHGSLSFDFFKEGAQAELAAQQAIDLKRQWLKSIGLVSPAFQGAILDRFFKRAACSETHPTGLRVSQLCVDERPAAIEIGIQNNSYYGAHLGAYDPDFIAHSPGSLQMQDTISALIDEGVEIIDLFAPGDPYKFEWTQQSVPVYDFSFPLSIKGHIYEKMYLKRARPWLKKCVNKLSEMKKSSRKKKNA